MVKSLNPIDKPFVLSVSVVPDLVDAIDANLKSPNPVTNSLIELSLDVADDPPLPDLEILICIFPPALKNQRAWLALVKLTVCSTTCDPAHLPDDAEVCSAADVVTAVALGEPASTDAASVSKSAANAATIAIGSPIDLADVEVNVSFV